MRREFLTALNAAAALPEVGSWREDTFEFLRGLPGFLAVAVRGYTQGTQEEPRLLVCRPLSPEVFLGCCDLATNLMDLLDPASSDDAPSLFNTVLPDGTRGMVQFSTMNAQGRIFGEVIVITQATDAAAFAAWGHFLEVLAGLLAGRLQAGLDGVRRDALDAASVLKLLNDIHDLPLAGGWSAEGGPDRWFDEDAEFMRAFLHAVQQVLRADVVGVLHRVGEKARQHLFVSAWCSSLTELPGAYRQNIDLFLDNAGVDIQAVETRVFASALPAPLHPEVVPSYSSIRCGNAPDPVAHLFLLNASVGSVSERQRYLLLAALGNHLDHRLRLLEKNRELARKNIELDVRNRETERDYQLLRQINSVATIITQYFDPKKIVETLSERLGGLFGIRNAAILLLEPGRVDLQVKRSIGGVPLGLADDPALQPGGHIYDHVMDGAAWSRTHSEVRQGLLAKVDMILPFSLSPKPFDQLSLAGEQRSLGGLVVFSHPDHELLASDNVRELLTSFLNNVSAALLKTFEYQQKVDVIQGLESLIRLLDNHDGMLDEMVRLVIKLLRVKRCSLLMRVEGDPGVGDMLCVERGEGLPEGLVAHCRIPWGEEISGFVAASGRSLRVDDIEADARFRRRSREEFFNRSLLSVPLTVPDDNGGARVIGVINVNNKVDGLTFTDQEQQLLESVARLAGVAIEHNRLRDAEKDRERIELEFENARSVQRKLVPTSFELPKNVQVASRYEAARECSGDFLDAFMLPDGRCLLAIGDVSGKGMPAALMMVVTRIWLRTSIYHATEPGAILAWVNEKLLPDMDPFRFVTMMVVTIDLATGAAKMASAGHGGVLVLRERERPEEIESEGGAPLGIGGEARFPEVGFTLGEQDLVLLLTDGMLEARNQEREMFGHPRVVRKLVEVGEGSPDEIVDALLREAQEWVGAGQRLTDDLALLAARWLGPLAQMGVPRHLKSGREKH